MPHLLVEFTVGLASDAQVEASLDALHAAIAATGLFDPTHIRLRATPLRHHRCGGDDKHFVHAQLRIHTGRSTAQKARLSSAILGTLQQQQWPAADITVEVVEMERESYAKLSVGAPAERS